MLEVGCAEAGRVLDKLLDRVQQGEEVLILRQGEPIARLVPERPRRDRGAAHDAAAAILAMSRGVTLGGSLRELIEAGRP